MLLVFEKTQTISDILDGKIPKDTDHVSSAMNLPVIMQAGT
jgi:hypothetical protein